MFCIFTRLCCSFQIDIINLIFSFSILVVILLLFCSVSFFNRNIYNLLVMEKIITHSMTIIMTRWQRQYFRKFVNCFKNIFGILIAYYLFVYKYFYPNFSSLEYLMLSYLVLIFKQNNLNIFTMNYSDDSILFLIIKIDKS